MARRILSLGVGDGRKRRWQATFSVRVPAGPVSPQDGVGALLSLAHQWARAVEPCEVILPIATPSDARPTEDKDMDVVPTNVPGEMDSFVRALTLGGNASTLVRAHVCPYCLYFSLAGEACKAVPPSGSRYDEYPTTLLYDALVGPFSRSNKTGWLAAAAAAAAAHNREQHATNGNIDSVIGLGSKAVDQTVAYRIAFWDGKGIQIDKNHNPEDLMRRAIECRHYVSICG